MCVAKNMVGSVTATTKVIIAEPATISSPPRNVTVFEGLGVEMVCEAKALPSNVSHRWFHNGTEINQLSWLTARTVIRPDGTLYINQVSHDEGIFTCVVSNGFGDPETASAHLSIRRDYL